MRPTKAGVQSFITGYTQTDAKGPYLYFPVAEVMLDKLLEKYVGVMCEYKTRPSGVEELIIKTAACKVELCRIRVKR